MVTGFDFQGDWNDQDPSWPTPLREIGRRAGYSRTMVHARYGGKDAILEDFAGGGKH